MQINNPVMLVDSKEMTLEVAPRLINGNSLVHTRAVAWGLNLDVSWNDKTKTVEIIDEPDPEPEPAPLEDDVLEVSPPSSGYCVDTIIDKADIKKPEYMLCVKDDIYFITENILKRYDGNTKSITSVIDFKDLTYTAENSVKDYHKQLKQRILVSAKGGKSSAAQAIFFLRKTLCTTR